jgi:cation transporter-like permease
MKAFLWAVLACVVISVGAGVVLTSQESDSHSSRTGSSVRLN